MTPQELLEKAIAEVGEYKLAEMLGYKFTTAARTYARWESGKEPDYKHTLILLDAAGLLRKPDDVLELQHLNEELDQLRARRRRQGP